MNAIPTPHASVSLPRRAAWVGLLLLVSLLALPRPAHAADLASFNATLKATIERHTLGKVVPSAVAPTPVAGIYEVVSGQEVFYVDASGRYAFVEGRLVDLQGSRDLTADRLDALSRIDFGQLPLELAVRQVRGSGRRVLAVFEDPGCPVCRVLHKFIDQLPDVTVYRFFYPVTDPASAPMARDAWCAADRQVAWSRLMSGGGVAPAPACDTTGLERILALGDQLQIQGTPTVFLANGRRLVGATPPDQFLAALDASAAQASSRPALVPPAHVPPARLATPLPR